MRQFAQLLNTLSLTKSHLDKMALIQDYFVNTPDPERGYALAIMANTLDFPTFTRSLLNDLIQEHINLALFESTYEELGDLVKTIASIWPESKHTDTLPLLSEIIATFRSNLEKNQLKSTLLYFLNRGNAIERWALLKMGTGDLRIGVSERFLKNTLARYGQVDVLEIEHLWHGLKPPYIELFSWLEGHSDKPSLIHPIYFHPVMLSHPLDEKNMDQLILDEFSYERKYDGIRVQVVSTSEGKALFSRTGDTISSSFPDVLESIDSQVILDGELVLIKEGKVLSFNELQKRLNRKTLSKKLLLDLPAGLILYDILSLDHVDLRTHSFAARRKILETWFDHHQASNLILSELLFLTPGQNLKQLKEQILVEENPAVEGLMIKNKESSYIAGRLKGHWYKWKRDPFLIDAVLMYAQRGQGKRSSYYSDYTFGLWDKNNLVTVGKAYFGFTDAELIELDQWIRGHTTNQFGSVREVEKERVFEVAFDAVNYSSRHKSGVALRFPRINRIRWDKPASEADQLDTLIQLIKIRE